MRAVLTHLFGPDKGTRERFDADRITVGRAPDNVLRFSDDHRRVSSHHAEIVCRDGLYLLRDLGSTNGTMINGRRVITTELNQDDLIEFGAGGPLLRFQIEQDEANFAPAVTDSIKAIGLPSPTPSPAASPAPSPPRSTSQLIKRAATRRRNGLLLVAIAIAMLIGATGGILLSSRAPARNEEELSFPQVADITRPAVVFIRVEFEWLNDNGEATATDARTGSGFIVSSTGLIVTNRHLVRDWEYHASSQGVTGRVTKIEVILSGQKRAEAIPAEVYRLEAEKGADVAILKINAAKLRFVRGLEPDLSHVNQGEDVAVIGYPFGLEWLKQTQDDTIQPALATGIVSRIGQDFIHLNLRAYQGNSGGPALNRKGEVIGILTGNISNAQDIAVCTPISAAVALINQPANLSAEAAPQERINHVK